MPLPCTTRTRGKPGQERAIHKFFDFAGGLVHGATDHIDFEGTFASSLVERDGDAPGARGVHRRIGGAGDHLGDVVAGNLHFHRADLDFKMLVIDAARD